MKQRIKHFIIAATLAFTAGVGVLVPVGGAAALDPGDEARKGFNQAGGGSEKSLGESIKDVINVLLFLIGAVSVIMIIIGGIRYVLSNGDSTQITGAKNTIMYAVIGLVVALLAYAIVNFVVTQFT